MFSSYEDGAAVMRFKSDVEHKNPAMRDFPLMRINSNPHPRTVWRWSLLTMSLLGGAIFMHLTDIGYEVRCDGAVLFIIHIVILELATVLLFIFRKQIPFLDDKLKL